MIRWTLLLSLVILAPVLAMLGNMSGVGQKIRRLRESTRVTQRRLAETAGLTVSYLSRLENGRITPSVKTLRKVALALEVPVPFLFGESEVAADHCPVSLSGSCILEHRYAARTELDEVVKPQFEESYSPKQLAVLQDCNDLLQHGDAELWTTLERVISSLVLLQKAREGSGAKKAEASRATGATLAVEKAKRA